MFLIREHLSRENRTHLVLMIAMDHKKTHHDQHPSNKQIARMIFHPLGMLGLSLGAGAIFSLYVIYRFDGFVRSWLLWYFMPVGVVFVAFILERFKMLGQTSVQYLILDLIVVLLSLARAVSSIPFYSGHALFLSYALLSARCKVLQILGAVVLLQVVYLKLIKWDDWITLTSGLLVGSLAGYYYRSRINQKLVR